MKLGTLTNSVIQIKLECDKLFALCDEYPTLEASIARAELKEKVESMVSAYKVEPGNTSKINELKIIVEANAIRLESILASKCEECKNKHLLRSFAKNLYSDMRFVQYNISRDESLSKSDIANKISELKWILIFYQSSKHILFELDEEDENKIKELVELIRTYSKEVAQ